METIYEELKDITHWNDYTPLDGQYYTFKNNIIFAGCKISDLYYQMCNPRMSLHFCCDYEAYSMMSDNEISILSTKKYFIENALLYYNFSVDYLWQVLWMYYNNADDKDLIASNELYQRLMKECNFNDLIRGLTEIREEKIVKVLKDNFTDHNKLYKQLREYYNCLKHRAIFHTPILGMNEKAGIIPIPTQVLVGEKFSELISYRVPLVSRVELDLEELKKLLIEFDKQFVCICEYFFEIIMPKNYLAAREVKIGRILEYNKEHLYELEKYSEKHPEIITKDNVKFRLVEKTLNK